MTKSHSDNYFQMGVIMAQQPDRKFSTKDFLRDGIDIRTIQRHLSHLEKKGEITSDGNNPRGYKLAF